MWPDRDGNYIAIYKCVKSTCCTPQNYTLYINYISIKILNKELLDSGHFFLYVLQKKVLLQ